MGQDDVTKIGGARFLLSWSSPCCEEMVHKQRQRTSYITPSEEHRLNPMIRDARSIFFRISSEEALLKKRHRAEN